MCWLIIVCVYVCVRVRVCVCLSSFPLKYEMGGANSLRSSLYNESTTTATAPPYMY